MRELDRHTGVNVTVLFDEIAESKAPRRVVFLDACRERLHGDTRAGGPEPRAAMDQAFVDAILRASGQAVLSAAALGGYSYDDHVLRNGVFTAAVVDGLKGEAPVDEQGFVTVETLARYVNSRMRSWLDDHSQPRSGTGEVMEAHLTGEARQMPLAVGPNPARGHLPSSNDIREVSDPELAMWKLVEASDNCDDVRFFLVTYPDGRYLNAATLKLRQLERKGCPTPPVALSSARSISERLRPARQFISAAGLGQAVTDDNSFSKAFVEGIGGRGDRDGDGYVGASELAGYLESTLRADSRGRPTPRYGTIRDPRLSQGDVLLGPRSAKLYAESVALVITAGEYRHWRRLPGVAEGGAAVAKALSEQGFKVQLVTDPTGEELRRQLWDLARVRAEKGRIVLYYAGHAFSMRRYGTNMGFLVPVDAPGPDAQHRLAFFRAALDMGTVEIMAQRLRALHALFVFDAPLDSTIFGAPTPVDAAR